VTSSEVRAALTERLRTVEEQAERLRAQHRDLVAAAAGSNSDDEHDPEGSTLAFEREQVTATIAGLERARADVVRALAALDDGSYGRCERCGTAIPAERLVARPGARSCVPCASRRR
jgi:RNA polymerase-binding transcription factor DksA